MSRALSFPRGIVRRCLAVRRGPLYFTLSIQPQKPGVSDYLAGALWLSGFAIRRQVTRHWSFVDLSDGRTLVPLMALMKFNRG